MAVKSNSPTARSAITRFTILEEQERLLAAQTQSRRGAIGGRQTSIKTWLFRPLSSSRASPVACHERWFHIASLCPSTSHDSPSPPGFSSADLSYELLDKALAETDGAEMTSAKIDFCENVFVTEHTAIGINIDHRSVNLKKRDHLRDIGFDY